MAKDKTSPDPLTRRERQVMNIVYARGQATAVEIHQALPDAPTFSATRAIIRTLQDKGHLRYQEQGLRYIYLPVVSPEKARKSALASMMSTFFEGSPSRLMATLLEGSASKVTDEEIAELEQLIRRAKQEKSQ